MSRGNVAQHQNDYWSSYIGGTVIITVDGTSRSSGQLAAGRYIVYCYEANVYLRQGGAGGLVTSDDFFLARGTYRDLTVDDVDNGLLYAMTADLGGKLRITRASSES